MYRIQAVARFSGEKLGRSLRFCRRRRIYATPQRSIFVFCASRTNVIYISRHFRLRKAKCESSAHTHHTCLDFTFSSNLGLFSCTATKNTYVDLSVLAQGNILRCFFIIQIAYINFVDILPMATRYLTSSIDICLTAFDIYFAVQNMRKQKASLLRDSILFLAY